MDVAMTGDQGGGSVGTSTASGVFRWQFAGRDPHAREKVALRIIAVSFFALAETRTSFRWRLPLSCLPGPLWGRLSSVINSNRIAVIP